MRVLPVLIYCFLVSLVSEAPEASLLPPNCSKAGWYAQARYLGSSRKRGENAISAKFPRRRSEAALDSSRTDIFGL